MPARIVFMGTPEFAVPILQALAASPYDLVGVCTQPDRFIGRKRKLSPPPVKVAAESLRIPVFQPPRIREPDAVQYILRWQPDIIITAAYGQILPEQILQRPPYGCINVHASLLPKYRGGAPIHWALIRGEKETGITLMYMVKELDAGDMIRQRSVPIDERDHVGTLHDKLQRTGAELLLETLPDILSGKVVPVPQDHTQATYAPNIRRSDEVIRWKKTAWEVYNQVRGLHPWPVAYTRYQGKIWKIWWGEAQSLHHHREPGTILSVEPNGLLVACGQDAFLIQELQPAGKKRMSVENYLRGQSVQTEIRLGDDQERG